MHLLLIYFRRGTETYHNWSRAVRDDDEIITSKYHATSPSFAPLHLISVRTLQRRPHEFRVTGTIEGVVQFYPQFILSLAVGVVVIIGDGVVGRIIVLVQLVHRRNYFLLPSTPSATLPNKPRTTSSPYPPPPASLTTSSFHRIEPLGRRGRRGTPLWSRERISSSRRNVHWRRSWFCRRGDGGRRIRCRHLRSWWYRLCGRRRWRP